PVEISSGEQTRDYVHVEDVMDAAELVASHPRAPGQRFNLFWGAETAVRDVVTRMVALTGSGWSILFGGKRHILGWMWELWGSRRKAGTLLGWTPKTLLDDGLRATIDWFRKHAAAYDEYRL